MPVPMDFLQQIGQLLGLTPQPAQAATPQPIQTPAGPSTTSIVGPGGAPAATPTPATTPAATSPGGLTGFLSNPLVEGALGAGLGYLAQPRGQGLMRRLGVAGLTGLEGFESAEAAQAKLPQQRAELQKAQADAQLAQQKAAYGAAHPDSAGPAGYLKMQAIKQNNTNVAKQFKWGSDSANLPPSERKIADAIAFAAAGSTKELTYKDLIEAHVAAVKDPYALKEVLADLAEKKAKTTEEKARTDYLGAETSRTRLSAPIGAPRAGAGRERDPVIRETHLEGMYKNESTDRLTGLPKDDFPDYSTWRANKLRELGIPDTSGLSVPSGIGGPAAAAKPAPGSAGPTPRASLKSLPVGSEVRVKGSGGGWKIVGHEGDDTIVRSPDGATYRYAN